jgi:predicted deacetylase
VKLFVSIHDVSPAHEAAVHRLWELCRMRGLRPALLVVPNWHGAFPLEVHDDFTAWCRAAAAAGADIFLHGMRHDEVGASRGWRDEVRAFGRTDREGEFLTLRKEAARARIDEGLAVFRRVGLAPLGFIPPAWLARRDCRDAAAEAGLRLSEDERAVYVHPRGERLPSPVLRWSARTHWRARASALLARASARRYAAQPLVRIALHPQDLSHPTTAASIERTLDRWLAARNPCSYSAL